MVFGAAKIIPIAKTRNKHVRIARKVSRRGMLIQVFPVMFVNNRLRSFRKLAATVLFNSNKITQMEIIFGDVLNFLTLRKDVDTKEARDMHKMRKSILKVHLNQDMDLKDRTVLTNNIPITASLGPKRKMIN